MGWETAVESGAAAPTCITLGAGSTIEKVSRKAEAVFVKGMDVDGGHGQTKLKRIKHTITASGKGSITASSTETGASEATAIVDDIDDGKFNEKYDEWSFTGHWFESPA